MANAVIWIPGRLPKFSLESICTSGQLRHSSPSPPVSLSRATRGATLAAATHPPPPLLSSLAAAQRRRRAKPGRWGRRRGLFFPPPSCSAAGARRPVEWRRRALAGPAARRRARSSAAGLPDRAATSSGGLACGVAAAGVPGLGGGVDPARSSRIRLLDGGGRWPRSVLTSEWGGLQRRCCGLVVVRSARGNGGSLWRRFVCVGLGLSQGIRGPIRIVFADK
ncbi:uncharacterized protein LOC125516900 [Triticum urartu]|uniref:uncharacterized protein LOC125516900 n=1 Tax=Triticum urartu TaxID=4572 RepID=UPI002042E30F|nr:uncharacterized protein LOC125516900 [Triticum urartu]